MAEPKPAPWRGRGRVENPRTHFVAVRCTDAEYTAITDAAARAGMPTGTYLRTIAVGSPGPRAARRPPVEQQAIARMLGLLGQVNSNVTRLAGAAATTGEPPADSALAGIAADIRDMRAALMKALGRGDQG